MMKFRDLKDILAGIVFLGFAGFASWFAADSILKENPKPVYSKKTHNYNVNLNSVRHFDFNHNGKLDEEEVEAYRANFEEHISTLRENILYRIERDIKDYTEESH